MRTGSIYDMADVLKSLTFLSKSKSLSFREKRMLDRAKALIISEVSEVMREKAPRSRPRSTARSRSASWSRPATSPAPRRAPRSPSRSRRRSCADRRAARRARAS